MIKKHLDEDHNELNDHPSIGQRTGRAHLFGKRNTPSQHKIKYTEVRERRTAIGSFYLSCSDLSPSQRTTNFSPSSIT